MAKMLGSLSRPSSSRLVVRDDGLPPEGDPFGGPSANSAENSLTRFAFVRRPTVPVSGRKETPETANGKNR